MNTAELKALIRMLRQEAPDKIPGDPGEYFETKRFLDMVTGRNPPDPRDRPPYEYVAENVDPLYMDRSYYPMRRSYPAIVPHVLPPTYAPADNGPPATRENRHLTQYLSPEDRDAIRAGKINP